MLKQHDIDFINMIKTGDGIDIQTLNDVKDIASQKEGELNKKLNFLSKIAKSEKLKVWIINRKIEALKEEYNYWKTVIGYCVFKKIDEAILDYDACINDLIIPSEYIINKLDKTILASKDKKIKDIICDDGRLIVISEDNKINCEIPSMYTPATNYIGVKLINVLNYSMASLGINQFINIRSCNLKKANSEEIYAHYSTYSNSSNAIYIDFEFPKTCTSSNNSVIKMMIINENSEIKMAEISYSLDFAKENIDVKEIPSLSSLANIMERKTSLILKRTENN